MGVERYEQQPSMYSIEKMQREAEKESQRRQEEERRKDKEKIKKNLSDHLHREEQVLARKAEGAAIKGTSAINGDLGTAYKIERDAGRVISRAVAAVFEEGKHERQSDAFTRDAAKITQRYADETQKALSYVSSSSNPIAVVHDMAVADAKKDYDEIQKRETKTYDKQMTALDAEEKRTLSTINSLIEKESSKPKPDTKTLERLNTDLATKTKDFEDRRANITSNRDTAIETAHSAYEKAKANREQFQAQSSISTASFNPLDYASKNRAVDWIDKKAPEGGARSTVANNIRRNKADTYVNMVTANQRSNGEQMIALFGTEEQKTLLKTINDDKAAREKARQEGTTYKSPVSKQELKAAEVMIASYTGQIDTKAHIKQSIALQEHQCEQMKGILKNTEHEISVLNKEIDSLKNDISTLKTQIKRQEDIQNSIATRTDSAGKKLSKNQIAQLKSQAMNPEEFKTLQNKMGALLNKKDELIKDLNAKDSSKSSIITLLNRTQMQVDILKKDGNKFLEARNKQKRKEHDKRTERKIGESIGSALMTISSLHGLLYDRRTETAAARAFSDQKRMGNKINSMYKKTVRTTKKAGHITMAVGKKLHNNKLAVKTRNFVKPYAHQAINFIAINPMKKLGGALQKGGQKVIHVIGSTRRGQLLGAKINKFKEGKFAKGVVKGFGVAKKGAPKLLKGARFVGGKGLKLAVNGLILAPQVFLDPEEMAKKGMIKIVSKTGRLGLKGVRKGSKVAAKGGKLALKGTNTAVKYTARGGKKIAKKAIKKMMGKSKRVEKTVKTAQKWAKAARTAMTKVAKGIKTILKFFAEAFKWILTAIKTLLTSIISFISSLITSIIAAIGPYLLAAMLILILGILLLGVLDTILEWLEQFDITEKSYVKNNPGIIMMEAVKYRNQELEILDKLSKAAFAYGTESSSDLMKIRVNSAPIYHMLQTSKTSGSKFSWSRFWDSEKDRFVYNHIAYKKDGTPSTISEFNERGKVQNPAVIEYAADNLNAKGLDIFAVNFVPDVDEYSSVKYSYHPFRELKYDANYTPVAKGVDDAGMPVYELQSGVGAGSKYEISSAKDAWALVDALYTDKKDDMQKAEVYNYLGIGDTQVGFKTGAESIPSPALDIPDMPQENQGKTPVKDEVLQNLFWGTHKFIYKTGNTDLDYWFHQTVKHNDGNYRVRDTMRYKTHKEVVYDRDPTNDKYVYDGGVEAVPPESSGQCNNKATHKIKIKVQQDVTKFRYRYDLGDHFYGYSTDGRRFSDGYRIRDFYINGDIYEWDYNYGYYFIEGSYLGRQNGYYLYGDTRTHYEERDYEQCKGHIDLDVAIVVASFGKDGDPDRKIDDELFFSQARKIQGIQTDDQYGGFIYDFDNDVWGFGILEKTAFNPAEDWKPNSKYYDLAMGKAAVTEPYGIDIELEKALEHNSKLERHYESGFASQETMCLGTTTESDTLVFAILLDGQNKFYVESYVSGEQVQLIKHAGSGVGSNIISCSEDEEEVDIVITDTSKAMVSTHQGD